MRPLRSLSLLLVGAVLVAGCGLGGDPVVQTQDEVLDALLALSDGAEARLTATLEYDDDEVRDALRDDPEARALLQDQLDGGDVDALLAELASTRDRLAEHALLLGTGADGSGRVAAAYRDRVWLDLRVGGDLLAGEQESVTGRIDVQAQVDWATASELLEEPDLFGDLDEVAAQVAPFLDSLPETDAVQRVLLGLIGGELVAISGPAGPELLDGLGALAGMDAGGVTALRELDLEPRELLDTALTFDGFRVDGEDTLVDVHLKLRAASELVLERVAAAPETFDLTSSELEEARARLAEVPERLDEVALLRLGPDGTVRQVRADVIDVALQLAQATGADEADLSVAERFAAELDATGLFVLLDVTAVGTTPTVLGDPVATATPEEVARAIGGVLFRGLGASLGGTALQDLLATAPGG